MPEQNYTEFTSLKVFRKAMAAKGCRSIFIKRLASNDNSKNQVYLGSDFETLNIIPNKGVYVDGGKEGAKRDRFKADIDLFWTDTSGELRSAPNAKLILYPRYPEVRMSGFLKGSKNPPSCLMASRMDQRVLFLAISPERKIIAHAVSPDNPIVRELEHCADAEQVGVFQRISVSTGTKDERQQLIDRLREIHLEGWINSVRLGADGTLNPCNSSNCGGYTLEAQLGITPNGYSEPDYLGWEIKQHGLKAFDRPNSGNPITLMTPEPTAGFYKEQGVETFIRHYGYPDQSGKKDRLNFGGIFRFGAKAERTGLTLRLPGYNTESGIIEDADGGVTLEGPDGEAAATWKYDDMMRHWNRKHAQACFVPSLCRKSPERQYCYGSSISLGSGTDFLKFLDALAKGTVYYDPGIKLENASTDKPRIKRRSQFRIKSANLSRLYDDMKTLNLSA